VTLEVQTRVRIFVSADYLETNLCTAQTTNNAFQDDPLLYVLDTPGVLDPHYSDNAGRLKLSLCNLLIKVIIVVEFNRAAIHRLY